MTVSVFPAPSDDNHRGFQSSLIINKMRGFLGTYFVDSDIWTNCRRVLEWHRLGLPPDAHNPKDFPAVTGLFHVLRIFG